MIKSAASDDKVELWFACHRQLVSSTSLSQLLEVAEWIGIVGIPANDRKAGGALRTEKIQPCAR